MDNTKINMNKNGSIQIDVKDCDYKLKNQNNVPGVGGSKTPG